MYLTKQELRQAVIDCRAGDCSALAMAAQKLGEGITQRYRYILKEMDAEEAKQEATIVVLSRQERIDLDSARSNIFSFLTTCVHNHFRHIVRSRITYRVTLDRYAAETQGAKGRAGQQG